MNYCSKCGTPVEVDYSYCTKCGNRVNYGGKEKTQENPDFFNNMAEGLARGSLNIAKVMLKMISVLIFVPMSIASFVSICFACIILYNFAIGSVLLIPRGFISSDIVLVLSGVELLIIGCFAGFIGIGLGIMSYTFGKCVFTATNLRIGDRE